MQPQLSVLLALVSVTLAFPTFSRGGLSQSPRAEAESHRGFSRRAAAPYSPKYPYTGAKIDGLPGAQLGGVQVPAPGDTAHQFQHPPVGAMRGPCPGLNTAANHAFISRDGITTFDELVAAQQNLYNVGYDLAVVLATLGVAFDGDVVTEKLSIGGDATAQTSSDGGVSGKEGGLDTHDTFESDTSLTRNDYYLANGDDHTFNGTLFQYMTTTAGTTSSPSAPLYNLAAMTKYRYQRYQQSLAENGQFFYGPRSLLLYGAASFLYELMPNAATGFVPDLPTISSFFGARKASSGQGNATGGWDYVPERIPAGWYNRVTPYTLLDVAVQILAQYLGAPVLFGGNAGVGHFQPVNLPIGLLSNATATDLLCDLYQTIFAQNVPDQVSLPADAVAWALGKLNPIFATYGCPILNED